jgi:hypothetical protein
MRSRVIAFAVASLSLAPAHARAQGGLGDVRAVRVTLAALDSLVPSSGVDTAELRRRVTRRLVSSGIRVGADPRLATVAVGVALRREGPEAEPDVSVTLELRAPARDGTPARPVWRAESPRVALPGYQALPEQVPGLLEEVLAVFVQAYADARPARSA